MPRAGLLLQLDGSPHAWLEERGPRLVLLGAIDDATGEVLAAVFREQEDSVGYFLLLRQVVRTRGVPCAVYTDRHSIFTPARKKPLSLEEQLRGYRRPTQFGQLLEAFGIASVFARSPQAKGRIERLWNTLQDRLVSELRLAGASTLEAANEVVARFLPDFNRRFPVPPAQPDDAFRPTPDNAEDLFCFRYNRVVATDNTVRIGDLTLQVTPGPGERSYARARVQVQHHLDGHWSIHYQGRTLPCRLAPPKADALRTPALNVSPSLEEVAATGTDVVARATYKPPTDHPWRKGFEKRCGHFR